MTYIDDLKGLCKKHNISLRGQLLVSEGCENQHIEFVEQAYWGESPIRDQSAIKFSVE